MVVRPGSGSSEPPMLWTGRNLLARTTSRLWPPVCRWACRYRHAGIAVAGSRRGVRTFRLHEDRDQPGHFTFYQRFHNQHGVDLHVQTDHFALSLESLEELADGGSSTVTSYHVRSQ